MVYLLTQDASASDQLVLANSSLTTISSDMADVKQKIDAIAAAIAPVPAEPGSEPQILGAGSVLATSGTPLPQLYYTGDQVTAAGLLTVVDGMPDITLPYLMQVVLALQQLVDRIDTIVGRLDVPLSSLPGNIAQEVTEGFAQYLTCPLPYECNYYSDNTTSAVVTKPLPVAHLLARAMYTPQVAYFTDIEEPVGFKVGYRCLPFLSAMNPAPELPNTFGNGKASALPGQTMFDADLSYGQVTVQPPSAFDPWKSLVDGTPITVGPDMPSIWYTRNPPEPPA
jgi:hypothetical protein